MDGNETHTKREKERERKKENMWTIIQNNIKGTDTTATAQHILDANELFNNRNSEQKRTHLNLCVCAYVMLWIAIIGHYWCETVSIFIFRVIYFIFHQWSRIKSTRSLVIMKIINRIQQEYKLNKIKMDKKRAKKTPFQSSRPEWRSDSKNHSFTLVDDIRMKKLKYF